MQKCHTVSLDMLPGGRHAVVRRMCGGNGFTGRLAALGISLGTKIRVLQNWGHGPVLVLARGTRIALGRDEAQKVQVEALRSP